MSQKGRTHKPCPACGKPCDGNDERPYDRPNDGICELCLRVMQYGRDYLSEKEELKNKENVAIVGVPNYPGRLYFGSKSGYDYQNLERLGQIIHELAILLSEEVPKSYYETSINHLSDLGEIYEAEFNIISNGYRHSGEGLTNRIFKNKHIAELIGELNTEFTQRLIEVEKSGIKYGTNLLLQLNNKDITLDQINESI